MLVPGRKHGEYILFCRESDPEQETWNGRRAGQEGAVELYGADDAFPIDDIDDILPGLLEGTDAVYYTMGGFPEFDKRLMGWVNHIKTQSEAAGTRRRSSSRSITCCTTCACSRAARSCA